MSKDVNINELQLVPAKYSIDYKSSSYFDGGIFGFIGWRLLGLIITILTVGIGRPWAKCLVYSWQFKHTVYDGKRLKFEGTGGDLFVNIFKWVFLSIITLGIYALFVPAKKAKWIISNLHFEEEELIDGDSYFTGKSLRLLGLTLLCNLLNILSLGILYPFTVCLKMKWMYKHIVINRRSLAFTGTASSLLLKCFLWIFLSVITLGIFTLWITVRMLKWQTKNIHLETFDTIELKKDKSLFLMIPMGAISLALLVSLILWIANFTKVDWMNFYRIGLDITKLNTTSVSVQHDMYNELLEMQKKKNLSKNELDNLVKKYNLFEAQEFMEKVYGNKI